MEQQGKCIIFSAPSGAGKTTIVRALIERIPVMEFSISACSRAPRLNEIDGKDYHFLSVEKFKNQIQANAFIEWEEVYKNHFYGTLKSEIDRIWSNDKVVIFDVDVYGGVNLKKVFGDQALSIFVMPPSKEDLEIRLRHRSTETEERIQTRLAKAEEELELKEQFDVVIVNDVLEEAINQAEHLVSAFIG
jgi:guanylate kinase